MGDFFETIIKLVFAWAAWAFIIWIVCLMFGLTWTAKAVWIALIIDIVVSGIYKIITD
jgi:hypothetical protein